MKTITHRIAGLGLAAGIAVHTGDYFLAAGVVAGANAPDWLEIPWRINDVRHSVIPHRTVTHWFLPWVTLLSCSAMLDGTQWTIVSGFSIGALLHILMDATTPMGVPVMSPLIKSRRSF